MRPCDGHTVSDTVSGVQEVTDHREDEDEEAALTLAPGRPDSPVRPGSPVAPLGPAAPGTPRSPGAP